jgi:hypothetical protein
VSAEEGPGELEPAPPYDRRYLEGLARFNAERFWDAHETLEDLWGELSGGPKRFYQGLIQLAAAFHLVLEGGGRLHGAAQNFDDAREKFASYGLETDGLYGGLDCAWLAGRAARCRDEARAVARGEREAFDRALFFTLWPGELPDRGCC